MKCDRISVRQLSYIIVLIYAAFSSLWILGSDWVLARLTDDLTRITELKSLKDWVFVLMTSGLLYMLICPFANSLQQAEKYRSIFENALEGIYQVTPDGHYISVNLALARIYGYETPEQLYEQNWWQLNVEPHQRTNFLHQLQQIGSILGFESQVYRADGSIIWTKENVRAVRDANGVLLYYQGTVEDITARVVATTALHKTYTILSAIVEGTTDAVFVKDLQGRYRIINSAVANLIGKSVTEIIGKNDTELFSQETSRRIQERDREIEAYGETQTFEEVLTIREIRRTFLVTKGIYRDPDGNAIGSISIAREISDRKQSEESLLETTQKLEALIRAAPVAIDILSPEGDVVMWNPAAERMFGWSADEAIGRPLPIVTEEKQNEFESLLANVMEGGTFTGLETQRCRKDRTRIDVSLSTAPLRDAKGQIMGAMGILVDISDRKHLERERDRLILQLRQETEDLRALSIVTGDSISTLNLSELLDVLLSRIVEVMQADAAVILLKDNDRLHLRASVGIEHGNDDPYNVRLGECFAGRIAAMRHPLYVPDATSDPRITSEFIKQRGVCTMLGVPLQNNGNLMGVLQVEWLSFHQSGERETHLLEVSAERCTMAILNAQLYEQTKQLRDRLQLQIDRMPIGCIVLDSDFRIADWNPAAERIFGFTPAETIGQTSDAIVPPSERSHVYEIFQRLSRGDMTGHSVNENITKDGDPIVCEWYNTPLFNTDRSFHGILSMVQDITERQRAQEALKASEAELRALFDAMTDVILVFDDRGRYLKIAPTNPELLYKPAPELLGKTLYEVFERTQADTFIRYIHQALETQKTIDFEYSLPIGDRVVWFSTKISPMNQEKVVWVARDITDRKETEEQLKDYAFYDALTGLPNRTSFTNRLQQSIDRCKQWQEEITEAQSERSPLFAVLLLDLDRFRIVKYSLGHQLSDRLLIATAYRLTACLRPTDLVARIGGDEFAILLEEIQDVNHAKRIADCIHSSMRFPFNLDDHEVFCSTSIGIAVNTIEYNRPEDVLRDADTALDHAKKLGKGRSAIFASVMHEGAVARLQLETDLRHAIDRQQFQVYYQAIVNLSTGQIAGFEALVRWMHPTKGIVSPGEFIPLAEETGLIAAIDWWVLREACRQLSEWQHMYSAAASLTMSVNMSGFNVGQVGTIERLDYILRSTKMEGRRLKLEITESVILENTASALAILEQLKSLGIQLSIDDFGTGYSSLARLQQLPIDTLKIDRSFVKAMTGLDESSEIVHTIVTLAHTLGMDAIAEGVETPQQLELLKVLECEYAQGYLFSRPVDREAALALLLSDTRSIENG